MKISIIGHCGSGKSTLAHLIQAKLAIPHMELDRLWFTYGGGLIQNDTEKQLVKDRIEKNALLFLTNHSSWVTDGLYPAAQVHIAKSADIILYIDIPLTIRMFNHLKRWWKNKNRHPEISRFEDFLFTFDMIRRTRKSTPKIAELIRLYPDKIKILNSYQSVTNYLERLERV